MKKLGPKDRAIFDDLVLAEDVDEVGAITAPRPGETPEAEVVGSEKSPFVDDWQAELARMSDAQVIPGTKGLANDLDQAIQSRELLREQYNRSGKQVLVNPPSAYRGIFGAQTVVSSGQTSDWLVWWTGEDIEATDVTIAVVNLGNTGGLNWPAAQTIAPANTLSYRSFANIRWGTRAFMNTATIDVGRGCQVSVSGSAVYVQLGLDDKPAGPTNTAGTMALAAMLSFGARQSQQPVLRTAYVNALINGTPQVVVVPNFAQTVTVWRTTEASAITMNFRDTGGAIRYSYTVLANTNMVTGVPIACDIYDIQVTNANATTDVRLIFGIAL